jgi:CheY-like chemotaxis protein
VFINILANAVKFTDRGGSIRVEVTFQKEEQEVCVVIRDSGIGIHPAMLPRLFEVFAQAGRSMYRSRGGLGLGLALAKGIVELHNGSIEAASEGLGRGATFTLRLPCRHSAQTPAPKGEPVETVCYPLRVLLVEDNRDAAESLRLLLQIHHHEVTVAYDGAQGIQAAQNQRPDVVVCDIGLPGMDGFDVARFLRQDPQTAGIRLIAMTGYGQDEDRRRAREAGFDHHLTKPVDPDELLGRLAQNAGDAEPG